MVGPPMKVAPWERAIFASIVTGALLYLGLSDYTDPTPDWIRIPIGGAVSIAAGWAIWFWADKPEAEDGE